jgi:PPM family protein phosphatase
MVGALSDIGNVRKINEDCVGYYEEGAIKVYIVADGMGGHSAGEIASRIAVDKTIEFVKSLDDFGDIKEVLKSSVLFSNAEIYRLSLKDKNLSGMGTTITACFMFDNKMFVGNIGDSSCFIINDSGIIKVTKDHSLVQQLVDEGSITEAEAKNHPNKNIITRSLGTGSKVDVDIFELPIKGVTKVILCTDGLTNEVEPKEILECVVSNTDNIRACKELIEIAKSRGGRDNISVMIFEGECRDDRNYTEQ